MDFPNFLYLRAIEAFYPSEIDQGKRLGIPRCSAWHVSNPLSLLSEERSCGRNVARDADVYVGIVLTNRLLSMAMFAGPGLIFRK